MRVDWVLIHSFRGMNWLLVDIDPLSFKMKLVFIKKEEASFFDEK